MTRTHMNEPCEHCPYRQDVVPFLRPERAADLAYSTTNPYATFTCHKTLGHDDDGNTTIHAKSLECAGFLSMQVNATSRTIEGFEASDLVYCDAHEMVEAYEEYAAGGAGASA